MGGHFKSQLLSAIYLSISLFYLQTHPKNRFDDFTSIKYYTKAKHDITIPIMVHLDKPLISKLPKHRAENKFMKRGKLKKMTKHILKNVEKIFRHPSLNQTVHLVLLDVKVLRSKFSRVAMDENVSVYLKSYCDWQGEKKVFKRKWYYSILLTGLDLYYLDMANKKIRGSTGKIFIYYILTSCAVRLTLLYLLY